MSPGKEIRGLPWKLKLIVERKRNEKKGAHTAHA